MKSLPNDCVRHCDQIPYPRRYRVRRIENGPSRIDTFLALSKGDSGGKYEEVRCSGEGDWARCELLARRMFDADAVERIDGEREERHLRQRRLRGWNGESGAAFVDGQHVLEPRRHDPDAVDPRGPEPQRWRQRANVHADGARRSRIAGGSEPRHHGIASVAEVRQLGRDRQPARAEQEYELAQAEDDDRRSRHR